MPGRILLGQNAGVLLGRGQQLDGAAHGLVACRRVLDHASVVGVPQHDLGVEGVDDLAAVCFEIRRGVVLYQRLNGCDVLFEGRIVEVVFGGLAQRGYGMTRLRLVGGPPCRR